ncbi:calcium-binding protein [Catellatospora sp. TT07R-123]|uniref:beta strand repeat-containing protein n=1 Tax=Catellatospora sp. TT07R-123 TaxID=2733863 RepID=UPI001BB37DAE|nr:calcium-binding protein [Catellatospora sp. TT07R-123]
MRIRRLLTAAVAALVAVPLAVVATPLPAQAAQPWETGLRSLMARTATWAEDGLGRVGQLAKPLPLLGVSPGSLVDADKLMRTAADALAAELTHTDEDLGGGARLTSTVTEDGGDRVLDVVLRVRKQRTAQEIVAAGVTVARAVNLTGWATLHVKARYTAAGQAYLIRDDQSPRIDVDALATLRPTAEFDQATAAIGILGVTLRDGSTLTARTHLKVTFADPNADGALAFDTASGTGTGELAATGSLAGLARIALDTAGGQTSDTDTESGPGSFAAVLLLGAAATGSGLALPAIDATVRIDWPAVDTGSPQATTEGLDDVVSQFANMSPLDLASGLAQLATLLGGVQGSGGAGNLNLPFLKGTFADAVKINEKLTAFLKKHVHPQPGSSESGPGDDPAKAGQPKFTSLQELLRLLPEEGLPVSDVGFSGGKLAFTLQLTRAATGEPQPLDPGAGSVSGRGATFTNAGFSVDGARFTPGALVGQRVVAGTSAGTVAANTADTVTLDATGWVGRRPAADSPWVVSSSAAHVGAVELGGLVTATVGGKKTGLKNANAQASFALVDPSYTARLTVVLDLRDETGGEPADRVLLRTDPAVPLFTANFPITTVADYYSTIGFLRVRLSGDLSVDPAEPDTDMLQVRFHDAADLSLGTLFTRLKDDPAGLFDVTTSVRTSGRVKASIPGATGALGNGVSIDLNWYAGDPEPSIDFTRLGGLMALDFNPDDPKALFALVLEALRSVNAALAASGSGTGLMDQQIPLVGRSARQLIGSDQSGVGGAVAYAAGATADEFLLTDSGRESERAKFPARLANRTIVIGSKAYRILGVEGEGKTLRIAAAGSPVPAAGSAYAVRPELADALDRLLAAPPETLQDALDVVNDVIGEDSGLNFTLDQRPGGPYLRLGLDWKRDFHTGGPLAFKWDAARDLISLESAGSFSVDVDAHAQLGLLLPLKLGAAPLLDHTSQAAVTVSGSADGLAVGARVGPLALDLGKDPDFGKVQADFSVGLGGLTADGPVSGLFGLSPTFTTAGTDCGAGSGGTDVAICARAPVFVNGCTPDTGTNILAFQLKLTASPLGFDPSTQSPDLTSCFANLALTLTDFNVGIDGYLAKIEQALRLASFDGKLPLVGDDLQQGQQFIAQLRVDVRNAIGPVLANATLDSKGLSDGLTDVLQRVAPGATATVTCQAGAPAVPCGQEYLQAVRISLTAVKGNVSAAQGCAAAADEPDEHKRCLELDVPLDLGIPGLSLKAAKGATGGVQARLGWKAHLDLVLDRTEGFYIPTHSGSDLTPELQIGAAFDLTDDLAAQLAFIQVKATKKGAAPLVRAHFAIDLKSSPGEQSCFADVAAADCAEDTGAKLSLARLGDLGSLLATSLTADVHVDLHLAAKVAAGNSAASALPGISADFLLDWGLSNHRTALAAGTGGTVTRPLKIEFAHLALDAGAFFSQILKPVLEKLKTVTGPLQPVIDTLYAPIPVLSDLSKATGGPDITLIWLARTFSTLNGGPKLEFVDTIREVIRFVNSVPDCDTGDECSIPIGDLMTIRPDKALNTEATAATAESLIDRDHSIAKTKAQVEAAVDAAAGSDGEKVFAATGTDHKSNAQRTGFTFPVFDNPGSLFGLILGQDVELVSFDSGPLELGFSWRQAFGPVYAPPPVFVTLSGSASVTARFIAGLDTAGIRHAIEAAQGNESLDAVKLLDGLYFKTADSTGKAVPVVTLRGEIAAGAEVSVLILKAGIEGGIRLTVGFSWNDPNNDGKFRLSEFVHALMVNPICLFTTSGQLSVFLRVYITIDLFLFSKKFAFTLVNAVLLDFRAQPDCEPDPPELGGTVGDTLVVFAGRFGKADQRGDTAWSNDSGTYEGDVIKVYALHYAGPNPDDSGFDGFAVEALGRRQEFMNPGLNRVVVDGRGYDLPGKTAMSVLMLGDGHPSGDRTKTSSFDRAAVVIGSDGNDLIRTGTADSYVDGRGGDDQIVTVQDDAHTAHVTGGSGADDITTGTGSATVAGDGTLAAADRPGKTTVTTGAGNKDLSGLVNWDSLGNPGEGAADSDGADHITVGRGANTVYGNGGDDVIGVLADGVHPDGANTLVGGPGADTVNGGDGTDTIHTSTSAIPPDPDHGGYGDADNDLPNSVDTGGGADTVYGSAGVDLVTSHSANGQSGHVYGYGADDVLLGGYGTDEVYGGPGQDYVIAEPSRVDAAGDDDGYGPLRQVTHTPLPAGVTSQPKLLVGGDGRDHVIGGDGGATIFGDRYLPAEKCADNTTYAQVAPSDQGDRDLILGGAGADVVSAGGGDDRADLGDGADLACGQLGDDVLDLGGGDDKGWGQAGTDQVLGGDGADLGFGNEGDDGVYGGPGPDTLEGDGGADQVFGGTEADVIYGGTREAGAADGADRLYGEAGEDRIVGDNGSAADAGGPYPLDLAGDVPTAGAGDTISGGDHRDLVYGGLGDDDVHGDLGDDLIEGNNGADTVHGDGGDDEIIGGSSQEAAPGTGRPDTGDTLYGDSGADLVIGDNGTLAPAGGAPTRITQARAVAPHRITLLDLGFSPAPGTSGADLILGGANEDVLLGQGGTDRLRGGDGADYAEGGPLTDWIEGDAGDDDLVGGSSTPYAGTGSATTGQPDTADAIHGGPGSDVVIGDNGQVLLPLPGQAPTRATVRVGATGSPIATRVVDLYDRGAADVTRHGSDLISGGDGVDLAWGQDGDDAISGDGDGDYAEGNGGADTLRGDTPLSGPGRSTVTPLPDPGWPGAPGTAADLIGTGTPAGQDDLLGGSSSPGFRDTGDVVEGNGGDDAILGDNGSLLRTVVGGAERVYTERYPTGAVPANATAIRTHDPDLPGPSTRFCTTAQATCEPAGAYGDDRLFGDGGNDGVWAQDGDDTVSGGDGDDDLFGELGADTLYGDAGRDAILGDRGGVMSQYLNADDVAALGFTDSTNHPKETYTGFRPGYYDRRVDLFHDTDGDTWLGSATSPAMVHDGHTSGGGDRVRGGAGADTIHTGYGDDLANGDSGGDEVFGADGADVLWGGKGCDPVLDAADPECRNGGAFWQAARGSRDQFVDHVFGGAGATSGPAVDAVLGSDLLDWRPRGSYPGNCAAGAWPVTTGTVTVDPCQWFVWTDLADADAANNQHHHGVDFIYGGWDRDVLQGDVSVNGPDTGDRLFDWHGNYNLFTVCNASYGGDNAIRSPSPHTREFLMNVAWGGGAGRNAADAATSGTSAYREIAIVYPADNDHGSGSAYPGTPGHFDAPSCTD